MSFTPPNHARALLLGLFFIWLHIVSVLWWHAATMQRVNLLSLAEGSLDIGVLVYGVVVVHRLFWVNLFPISYHAAQTFWTMPAAGQWVLHGMAVLILVGSLLLLLWGWYHAHRDRFALEIGLPIALILAAPLLVQELARRLVGIDLFQTLVAAVLQLL